MATENLSLPEISDNMSADVPRDINALAQAVDSSAQQKVANLDQSNPIDPDTTESSLILTNHENSPASAFFYIQTYFYEESKAQFATPYNDIADGVWYRTHNGSSWSVWKRIASDNDVDTAEQSAKDYAQNKEAEFGGSSNPIDPNTTESSLIVTDHSNAPSSSYLYIQTYFLEPNKAQFAMPYTHSSESVWYRTYISDSWSDWEEVETSDGAQSKIDTAEQSAKEYAYGQANDAEQRAKDYTDQEVGSITVPVESVNGQTGEVSLNAGDVGAETPSGAQSKADTAEQNANNYTDTQINNIEKDYVTGTYTGDGNSSQDIDLGFRPSAVSITKSDGATGVYHRIGPDSSEYRVYGGLFFDGVSLKDEGGSGVSAEVISSGFRVNYDESSVYLNSNNDFHYMAWK